MIHGSTTSEHQIPTLYWSVCVPARLSRKTARKSKRGQSGGGAAAGFTATSGGIRYLFGSATRHFHFSAFLFFLSSLASSSYFRAFPAATRLSHDIKHHFIQLSRHPSRFRLDRPNNAPLTHLFILVQQHEACCKSLKSKATALSILLPPIIDTDNYWTNGINDGTRQLHYRGCNVKSARY